MLDCADFFYALIWCAPLSRWPPCLFTARLRYDAWCCHYYFRARRWRRLFDDDDDYAMRRRCRCHYEILCWCCRCRSYAVADDAMTRWWNIRAELFDYWYTICRYYADMSALLILCGAKRDIVHDVDDARASFIVTRYFCAKDARRARYLRLMLLLMILMLDFHADVIVPLFWWDDVLVIIDTLCRYVFFDAIIAAARCLRALMLRLFADMPRLLRDDTHDTPCWVTLPRWWWCLPRKRDDDIITWRCERCAEDDVADMRWWCRIIDALLRCALRGYDAWVRYAMRAILRHDDALLMPMLRCRRARFIKRGDERRVGWVAYVMLRRRYWLLIIVVHMMLDAAWWLLLFAISPIIIIRLMFTRPSCYIFSLRHAIALFSFSLSRCRCLYFANDARYYDDARCRDMRQMLRLHCLLRYGGIIAMSSSAPYFYWCDIIRYADSAGCRDIDDAIDVALRDMMTILFDALFITPLSAYFSPFSLMLPWLFSYIDIISMLSARNDAAVPLLCRYYYLPCHFADFDFRCWYAMLHIIFFSTLPPPLARAMPLPHTRLCHALMRCWLCRYAIYATFALLPYAYDMLPLILMPPYLLLSHISPLLCFSMRWCRHYWYLHADDIDIRAICRCYDDMLMLLLLCCALRCYAGHWCHTFDAEHWAAAITPMPSCCQDAGALWWCVIARYDALMARYERAARYR